MDTEIIATSQVKLAIAQTDFLSSFINERDKEPSWDGFVYIYSNKNKKKADLKGRVPVQVKGKLTEDLSKNKITYPVEISDLNNYLYDGGIIYFVVYISNKNQLTKIYYAALLPVKIKWLLKKAKKSIELKEFPTDGNRKSTIFLNFLENKVKQSSFVNSELLSIEDLNENQNILSSITISVNGYGFDKNDLQKAFFDNQEELYLYANIKNCNIPQPIAAMPHKISTCKTISSKVYAKGELFYKGYLSIRTKEKVILQFGEGLTMEVLPESSLGKVNYVAKGKLRSRTKDLKFIINVIESQSFEIENTSIPIPATEADLSKFDLSEQKENLLYYEKLIRILDLLNVKEDLDVEGLSEEDYEKLYMLITAFIDKKAITGLKSNVSNLVKLEISNLKLALAFIKHGQEEGIYKIYDFFKTKFELYCEGENGIQQLVSQFSIFRKEDFMEISNIDFDVILSSYKCIKRNEYNIQSANQTMLILLSIYDESAENNDNILKVIKNFDKWIRETADETIPYEVKLLNHLQIVRREREFELTEIKQLCDIVEDSNSKKDILTGAHLLLGNQSLAEMHFNNLDTEDQKNFKTYPIYKFWNNK